MAEEKRTRPSRPLEEITTEELNDLIRADFNGTQPLEEDFLIAVLGELSKREPISEEQKIAAWERFRQNRERIEQEKRVKKILNWVSREDEPRNLWQARFARIGAWAATVALVIFLFAVPVRGSSSAFQIFINWTDSVFSAELVDPTHPTSAPSSAAAEGLAQIQAELDKYGVTERLVPSWLPDGFALEKLNSYKLDNGIYVYGVFSNEDKAIMLAYRDKSTANSIMGEKEDQEVHPYIVGDITYYLMSNADEVQCIWINGSIQGIISGDLLITDLEVIVNSIG